MLTVVRGMFQYGDWANRRIIQALRVAPDNPRALGLFAHVLTAEKVWLQRIKGEHPSSRELDFWPELTLAECERLADENRTAYETFFASLDAGGLDATASYKNSKGVEYRTALRDVFTHVAFHGAYHRGQIASALREAGVAPPNTDFIGFEREIGSPF